MFNHSKNFWSKRRANSFVGYLKDNGHGDLQVWTERDRLNNCIIYHVKWN
jgi:hypothetical protein